MDAMDLVAKFVKHYETIGIYDEFDKDQNKMVTSSKVYQLVQDARKLMPKAKKPAIASAEMAGLTDEERDEAIINAGRKVVDMRKVFQRKIADNGSARGLLERVMQGDLEAIRDAQQFLIAQDQGDNFTIVGDNN